MNSIHGSLYGSIENYSSYNTSYHIFQKIDLVFSQPTVKISGLHFIWFYSIHSPTSEPITLTSRKLIIIWLIVGYPTVTELITGTIAKKLVWLGLVQAYLGADHWSKSYPKLWLPNCQKKIWVPLGMEKTNVNDRWIPSRHPLWPPLPLPLRFNEWEEKVGGTRGKQRVRRKEEEEGSKRVGRTWELGKPTYVTFRKGETRNHHTVLPIHLQRWRWYQCVFMQTWVDSIKYFSNTSFTNTNRNPGITLCCRAEALPSPLHEALQLPFLLLYYSYWCHPIWI